MKLLIVFTGIMLWAAPLLAETYSWVDEKGTYNFTEDYSRVPIKYRKSVEKRGDMEVAPSPADAATPAGSTTRNDAGTGGKVESKSSIPEQLFGGKTQTVWQQELTAAQNELKRLDARVKDLASQMKNSGAYYVSRSQVDLERRYNAAVEEYNKANIRFGELLESARKAGINL